MPAPTLPYDVLRDIFDNISGDKKLLKQCSLVCRSWTLPTGHHLFYRLAVLCESQWEGWPPRIVTDSAQHLRLLTESARHSERMQSSVRVCVLEGKLEILFQRGDSMASQVMNPEYPLELLQMLIGVLPHLQSLSIDNVMFYGDPAPSDGPRGPFRSLDRLYLLSALGETSEHGRASNIFPLFARIGELHITYPEYCKPNPLQGPLVQVQRLVLTSIFPVLDNFVEELCVSIDFAALTSIHLELDVPIFIAAHPQLLPKCRSLETLSLRLNSAFWDTESDIDDFWFDLSACTKLRELRLWEIDFSLPYQRTGPGLTFPLDVASQAQWNFVCNVLSTIPSDNRLATVRLDIRLDFAVRGWQDSGKDWPEPGVAERLLGEAQWKQFDSDLSRFEHLQSVVFDVKECSPRGEEFVRMLQDRLSEKVRRHTHVHRRLKYISRAWSEDIAEKLLEDADYTIKTVIDSPGIKSYRPYQDSSHCLCQWLEFSA